MALLEDLVPTTETEAVNAMRATNGDSPVDDLDAPLPADVEIAVNILKNVHKAVLSRGWHFNTDYAVTLSPDGSDEIVPPTDAIRLRKSNTAAQRDLQVAFRTGKLFNIADNSFEFDDDVQFDIVRLLDFADCPETARAYVYILASRKYQEATLGNPELSGFSEPDAQAALQNLQDAEGIQKDPNALVDLKDQRKANSVFDAVKKQVLSQGFHFNYRREVALTPDGGDDEIDLPTGTLRAWKSPISSQSHIDAAHRGLRMYNVKTDTFTWDADTDLDSEGTLKVDLFVDIDFDDLPETARRYIEIRAARQLQIDKTGKHQGYTERDEYLALRDLEDAEGLVADFNLLRNMSVARVQHLRQNLFGTGLTVSPIDQTTR
jgi:hypothetical protein